MSIIVNSDTKVLVQGITGNEGSFHTAAMLKYGTKVVAGVTPNKGEQKVHGVPVYSTVAEAVGNHDVNTSIVFVPAPFARSAVMEAINAGIKTIAIITEHIPQKDSIEFITNARRESITIIGPNCPGIINPGDKVRAGIMPVHTFQPGNIGIVSRSGTLTYEIAWSLTLANKGQSTCLGIGGDPVIGLDFIAVLEMFKNDEETREVVVIGEIGGNAEEMAAQYIRDIKYPKPVVAYIAGRLAPPEKRMGHAGAIIMGKAGSASSKIKAFNQASVPVDEKPSDIVALIKT